MKKLINLTFIFSFVFIVFISSESFSAESINPDTESGKINFIQQEFDDSSLYSGIWWYGWMGIYGITAGVSFGVGLSTDDDTVKITQIVSGVQSVIGFAGLALSPMPSAYAGNYLSNMPEGTSEEKSRKLQEGERLLKETSEVQTLGSSWITHILNFTVAATGALVICKVYDDEIEKAGGDSDKEALYNFILSFAIGEVQILSQPTGGIKAWYRYRELFNPDTSTRFFIVPQYGGLAAGALYLF